MPWQDESDLLPIFFWIFLWIDLTKHIKKHPFRNGVVYKWVCFLMVFIQKWVFFNDSKMVFGWYITEKANIANSEMGVWLDWLDSKSW